ncbi:class I SAM-dependent methyltransferase [Cellulosilyticum sp. ST5]|uniref:class I SAM-dependent methyltransferase n=1 Tax=Cellulosilyticum sp. ST5 TaxID=3055805 RepID=UPI0039779964
MKKTQDFYNQNATEFFEGTVAADMTQNYTLFLECLPKGAKILDAGCGSGRDSLAFKKLGYEVTAIDGSEELCKLASEYIGQEVKHMQFQELDFENEFDGIWACATLLHIPRRKLPEVIERLVKALKTDGVLYASFKYGVFQGERKGRYFCDLTEEKAEELFTAGGLKIKKCG